MQFRSTRGSDVVLLLAMIKGVYPVGHRNERRKASGVVTAQIGKSALVARPGISPDGLSLGFSVPNGLMAGKTPPSFETKSCSLAPVGEFY